MSTYQTQIVHCIRIIGAFTPMTQEIPFYWCPEKFQCKNILFNQIVFVVTVNVFAHIFSHWAKQLALIHFVLTNWHFSSKHLRFVNYKNFSSNIIFWNSIKTKKTLKTKWNRTFYFEKKNLLHTHVRKSVFLLLWV